MRSQLERLQHIAIIESLDGVRTQFNEDFFVGYLPERINPGDKADRLLKIKKVTESSTPEVGLLINKFYSQVVTVVTYLASSIRVAEAPKVIENIVTVRHGQFHDMGAARVRSFGKCEHALYGLKCLLAAGKTDLHL